MEAKKISFVLLQKDIYSFLKKDWYKLLLLVGVFSLIPLGILTLLEQNNSFVFFKDIFLSSNYSKWVRITAYITPILVIELTKFLIFLLVLSGLKALLHAHIIGKRKKLLFYIVSTLRIGAALFILEILQIITTPIPLVSAIINALFVFTIPILLIEPTYQGNLLRIAKRSFGMIKQNFKSIFLWVGMWYLAKDLLDQVLAKTLFSLLERYSPIASAYVSIFLEWTWILLFYISSIYLYKQFVEIKRNHHQPVFHIIENKNPDKTPQSENYFLIFVSVWIIKQQIPISIMIFELIKKFST